MDVKDMRRQCATFVWGVLALAQTACAQAAPPADLTAFIEQRDVCDHLRGELPDPEEQEQLDDAVRNINQQCKGTDAVLAALKKKYADAPATLNVLNRYEIDIEAP
jgi:hypothetical protein